MSTSKVLVGVAVLVTVLLALTGHSMAQGTNFNVHSCLLLPACCLLLLPACLLTNTHGFFSFFLFFFFPD